MESDSAEAPVRGTECASGWPGFNLKWNNLLRNWEEIISGIGMVVIIAVISLNVFLRYFFNNSISWAEEISVIGFSCVIFIGSAAVFKRRMHVGIDFVVGLLPNRARMAVSFATSVFTVFFCSYISYLGWIYSVASWEKPTSILHIPYFFVNIPICIGFISMTVHAIMDVCVYFRAKPKSGTDLPVGEGAL